MVAKCSETVDRGHGRWVNIQPCGRDAVQDGLCKIHLRVRDRRAEKHREWNEKMRRGEEMQREAARLGRVLGIYVKAEYDTLREKGYTGRMVVPLDWLNEIAASTEKGKSDADH